MKLLDYIRGNRKGKDAHRLEKKSMRDPFLADAIEGYDKVKGDYARNIWNLNRELMARTNVKNDRYVLRWSIAAFLVLGLGISSYFVFIKSGTVNNAVNGGSVMAETEVAPVMENTYVARDMSVADSIKPHARKDRGNNSLIAKAEPPVTISNILPALKSVDEEEILILNEEENIPKPVASLPAESGMNASFAAPYALDSHKAKSADDIIKGTVLDEKGEPLVGVYVKLKDEDISALTDKKGEFVLNGKYGKDIQAYYIGCNPVTVSADTGNILITMKENETILCEVVTTGYGYSKAKARKIPAVPGGESTVTSVPVIGFSKYKKYLRDNMIRPSDARCKNVRGKVIVAFFVDADGRPYDVTVKKGLCDSADEEAVRLVEEGPAWSQSNIQTEVTVKF